MEQWSSLRPDVLDSTNEWTEKGEELCVMSQWFGGLLCREGGFRESCVGVRQVTARVLAARFGEKDVPDRLRR